ncbi:MAG TPA: hypothetical protein VGK64_06190 [Bryobacteraceae bacterium]
MYKAWVCGSTKSLAYASSVFVCVYVLLALPFIPAVMAVQGRDSDTALKGKNHPIVNLPYSAQRRFTTVEKRTDGVSSPTESGGSEARDSEGRKFSAGERHWIYTQDGKSVLKSEMLYRVNDPVAHTTTSWDSSSKVAKVVKWPMETVQGGSEQTCQSACDAFLGSSSEPGIENLGTRVIEGLVVEGKRSTYSVDAGTVVHEVWYSPELKIVILETNDNPRTGSWRNEIINISRKEPKAALFSPPKDYIVKEITLRMR